MLLWLVLLQAAGPREPLKPGESARFEVRLDGPATWRLGEDSRLPPLAEGRLERSGPLTASLDHPGFLLLEVRVGGRVHSAAAAFAPERIASTAVEPADFDAFWKAELDALRLVPPNPKVAAGRALKVELDGVEGRKVRGWVSVPEGKGPFPAVLEFPAFGSGALEAVAMPGAVYALVSVHEADPAAPVPNAYAPMAVDDHRRNYYKYALLGGIRMIDYLCSRRDVDGSRLVVTGKSQGGGLAIMAAGLDARVTHLSAVVPAFGQHAGTRKGRSSGFPQWVWQKDKDGLRGEGDVLLRESEYFETAHFAKRFRGQAHVLCAWIDTVCPPSSVMAAANALGGAKEVVHGPLQGHDWNAAGENWWPFWNAWVRQAVAGK